MNSDFKELLSLFNAYPIKYMVVEGYAVIKYTEPRFTKDLDLWIKADHENGAAVFMALLEFGAPLENMTEDDFAHEGYFYQMGIPPVRVDILMSLKGLSFDDAWQRRVYVDFGGVSVPFIAKQDLITTKLASGRPQDLIDVDLLSHSDDSGEKDLNTDQDKKPD